MATPPSSTAVEPTAVAPAPLPRLPIPNPLPLPLFAERGGGARLGHHAYSRKQNSLGLLFSNFMALYDRDGVEFIRLDDASRRLGVERRRIYDIVNVLESVGILARKATTRSRSASASIRSSATSAPSSRTKRKVPIGCI
ncbi:E2F transcription factor-like E2FE [Triticum dicoccoides]|uniref:E2F transcription factor-like E2FE n=1 Tax=Triticum dicoccoides TaxID=85692 RepID=UPI001891C458|nr:E2F transcription factor-like E2FE [Triticum dicoccoides]XP_037464353.1 E2F transcription factor-like E2FE [Triticum dicoccoides]